MRSSLFAFANFCNLSLGHSLSHSLTQTYCRSSSHFNNISSSWFACKLCTMLRCTQFSVLAWVLTQPPLDSRYGQTLMDVSACFFLIPTFDEGAPLDLDGSRVLYGRSSAVHLCWEICRGSTFHQNPMATTQKSAGANARRTSELLFWLFGCWRHCTSTSLRA